CRGAVGAARAAPPPSRDCWQRPPNKTGANLAGTPASRFESGSRAADKGAHRRRDWNVAGAVEASAVLILVLIVESPFGFSLLVLGLDRDQRIHSGLDVHACL